MQYGTVNGNACRSQYNETNFMQRWNERDVGMFLDSLNFSRCVRYNHLILVQIGDSYCVQADYSKKNWLSPDVMHYAGRDIEIMANATKVEQST